MTNILWTKINSPQDLLSTTAIFLREKDLPTNLVCDHICYRVETLERYEELKTFLREHSHLANESLVNGRPICIFELPSPLKFAGIQTTCIELPAPKETTFYQEGWEHAEFVTGSDIKEWIRKFPQLTFDTKAINKPINAEISLTISEKYKIKFHEKHILDVIKEDLNDK